MKRRWTVGSLRLLPEPRTRVGTLRGTKRPPAPGPLLKVPPEARLRKPKASKGCCRRGCSGCPWAEARRGR